jgi:hypothetical protein
MGRTRMLLLASVAASALAVMAVPAVGAGTQTFSTDQSEFPADPFWGGAGQPNQGTYFLCYFNCETEWHRGPYDVNFVRTNKVNYFSFDIRDACEASAVTLRLVRGSEVPSSTNTTNPRFGGSDWNFYRVPVSAFDLNVPNAHADSGNGPGSTATSNYFAIGADTAYGGGVYPDGSPTDVLSYPFNEAGVAGFNAARGDFLSLGGIGGGRTYFRGSDSITYRDTIFAGMTDPAKLVVTCALPSSKQQCKAGGWRDFGVFTNQGDCVSFVATKGRNGPAKKPG